MTTATATRPPVREPELLGKAVVLTGRSPDLLMMAATELGAQQQATEVSNEYNRYGTSQQ